MKSPKSPYLVTRPLPLSISLFGACLVFTSCGNSTSNLASQPLDSVKSLLPSRIPIATVRNKDLKELPSGADRALAWSKSLNRWTYAKIDYNPATLPDTQTQPIDSGLLPPLNEGESSILNNSGTLPDE